ncbi:MAG: helix-turn-helix domain-containing protein [bacterium]
MRQEIAEILGLTAETVSRVFTNFREAGFIQATRHSVRILDMTRLRAVADVSSPPQASMPTRQGSRLAKNANT